MLVRGNARALDHFVPLLDFRADERGKLLRRVAVDPGALILETFTRILVAKYFYESLVQLGNDRGRRTAGREYTIPEIDVKAGKPRLRHRRHFRRDRQAFVSAHAERAQAARLHKRRR